MRTSWRGGSIAALLTLAAVGCEDAGTVPASQDALLQNAAVVVADATIEDVALATAGFQFGGLERGFVGMGVPGELGGRRGIGGALSGTRELTFRDGAGNQQSAYDALTTAEVHTVVDLAGDVARGPWSASIERTRDIVVTGLEGTEATRTFNGSGTETVHRSRTLLDGTEATHDMSGTFTWEDVVVPVPGSGSPWPLSGSIHRVMTVTAVGTSNGDFSRTVDVRITFDGDNTAIAVIDGETSEIDLSAGRGFFPICGGFGRRGG